MSRKHHGRCIRAQVKIAAPADDVYRAWADPEHIAQWFVDRAEGTCTPGEVMTWIFDAFRMRLPIPILEAEPGKRIVTGSEAGVAGPLPVLMEVDIETVDGGTMLRLVSSGFSEDPDKSGDGDGVQSGWEMALATLKYWLEHGRPTGRLHHLGVRPTSASWPTLCALYAGADGLARWLDDVRAPTTLAAGDRISATLAGAPLTGAVLAHTGREVLVEWTELGGVIGLKAFAMGPARAVALDLRAWGTTSPAIASTIESAMERLVAAAGS
jgi:uncharacterized protein YndB with AHSA1/START domain